MVLDPDQRRVRRCLQVRHPERSRGVGPAKDAETAAYRVLTAPHPGGTSRSSQVVVKGWPASTTKIQSRPWPTLSSWSLHSLSRGLAQGAASTHRSRSGGRRSRSNRRARRGACSSGSDNPVLPRCRCRGSRYPSRWLSTSRGAGSRSIARTGGCTPRGLRVEGRGRRMTVLRGVRGRERLGTETPHGDEGGECDVHHVHQHQLGLTEPAVRHHRPDHQGDPAHGGHGHHDGCRRPRRPGG